MYDSKKYNRRSIRIPEYDYSNPNSYFITICTNKRKCILSTIEDYSAVGADAHVCPECYNKLSEIGRIVEKYIRNSNEKYNNVSIDNYVIMPNHIHLIITIELGQTWASAPTIPQIISTLKTLVTKEIGYSIWQRNYYEHIIRNEKEYLKVLEYVENNSIRWKEDINNI